MLNVRSDVNLFANDRVNSGPHREARIELLPLLLFRPEGVLPRFLGTSEIPVLNKVKRADLLMRAVNL